MNAASDSVVWTQVFSESCLKLSTSKAFECEFLSSAAGPSFVNLSIDTLQCKANNLNNLIKFTDR